MCRNIAACLAILTLFLTACSGSGDSAPDAAGVPADAIAAAEAVFLRDHVVDGHGGDVTSDCQTAGTSTYACLMTYDPPAADPWSYRFDVEWFADSGRAVLSNKRAVQ